MKTLIFLADMVRGDSVDFEAGFTKFETILRSIGGIWWSNAYTPAPDTPRSTGSMFSGLYPSKHGVNLRSKSCYFSYADKKPSLLRSVANQEIDVAVFRSKKEIEEGIWLPNDCEGFVDQFSEIGELSEWCSGREDFMIYWHDSSYHLAMDIADLLKDPHEIGLKCSGDRLELALSLAEFDLIWALSDHGCKFQGDSLEPGAMIDDSRTKIMLFGHEKGRASLEVTKNTNLFSIMDLYPTLHRQLGIDLPEGPLDGMDLELTSGHKAIGIEDWSTLNPSDGQLPDVFGLRFEDRLVTYSQGDEIHTGNWAAPPLNDPGKDFSVLARASGICFSFYHDSVAIFQNRSRIREVELLSFDVDVDDPLRTIFISLSRKISWNKVMLRLRPRFRKIRREILRNWRSNYFFSRREMTTQKGL